MAKFILALVLVLGVSQAYAISIRGNVMVGGNEDLDACLGEGIVLATTTLFTLKRGHMAFDKIEVNTQAYSCDISDDGEYLGIVFGEKNQNCQVSSPIPTRQEYKGPCKSGWIKKDFFELLAG